MTQSINSGTEARKARHLDVCLEEDVQSSLDPGWSAVHLQNESLPEIALADVDCSVTLLGHALRAPILISSMTGGTQRAATINRRLAAAAERAGIAIGLGSGRALVENPALFPTFAVRDIAPTALLFANIGAVQLNYGVTVDDIRRLVGMLRADALFIHLNPLQEAMQPNGDTDFRELLPKIARLCETLGVPVIAKGVGSGIGAATAARLVQAGVAGIDVAAAGGTSWALVEGKRSDDARRDHLASSFASWGTPTVTAIRTLRARLPHVPLVASGGIRDGVQIAKAIALGADACGLALPFLEAADESPRAVDALTEELIDGLRIAMFATGSATLHDLRHTVIGAPHVESTLR